MPDLDFCRQSLAEIAQAVRTKQLSARETVGFALDRIEVLNGELNAFVAVDGEAALAAAAAIDQRVAAGEEVGRMAGIPIGVKDLEDAAGFRTTKGSAAFADSSPAAHDSALVERLKAAGCVVVGKTNTPELGWKADTVNETFGASRNPWNRAHSPGGSSGGTAAAVAAGMVPLATGSDGGGSIRIPAALCGLSGFKPSLGRVPSGGSAAPDWSLVSSKGPMARTVADTVLALDAVLGPDPSDLRSLPMPEAPWSGALQNAHLPMRVAWSPTLGYAEVDKEVLQICEAAVDLFAGLGAEVVERDVVFREDPVLDWYTMAACYNARTLEPFRGTETWDRIDPGLREQVERAGSVSAVRLVRAEDAGHDLNLRLVELFRDVRLLVTPTTAAVAPVSGEQGVVNGSPTLGWVSFTYGFNMTRSPAGTVCAGFTSAGLPVGLQLVGPQHGDLVVLRAMAALEAALGGPLVPPLAGL